MKEDPVIVVVGLGNITRRHRRNLRTLFPAGKIVAVSASGRNVALGDVQDADVVTDNLAKAIGYQPSFAIVASAATSHLDHTAQLVKNGVPVLVEKPVVADSDQAYQLEKICQESNVKVAVAYCLRYLSSASVVKQVLSEGSLGVIYNAQISIGQYLPDWRPSTDFRRSVSARESLGGGVLLELSHEFDYLQWLLGPQNVRYACLRNSIDMQLEVEEFADVMLESSVGAISTVHLDFHQKSPSRRCIFIGKDARLEWDLIGNSVIRYDQIGRTVLFDEPSWDKNNMYLDMINDFLLMADGKQNNCVSLYEAVSSVLLVEQIKSTAFWGKSL